MGKMDVGDIIDTKYSLQRAKIGSIAQEQKKEKEDKKFEKLPLLQSNISKIRNKLVVGYEIGPTNYIKLLY